MLVVPAIATIFQAAPMQPIADRSLANTQEIGLAGSFLGYQDTPSYIKN